MIASLSLDLDNEWSYLKTRGDDAWRDYPSYLETVVPRFLERFAAAKLRTTVFVVGADAAIESNGPVLRSIADAGHEIGNHSFHHEPWLREYSNERIETEIADAHRAIERATGYAPRGFRGPGYSLSPATLETLVRHGYAYDASTLPTFLGPLARTYYFMTSRLTPAERAQRRELFGSWRDGLRPLRPYRWDLGDAGSLIEVPVTTFPLVKVPIHFSYVLFIALRSPALAVAYFRAALSACRAARIGPSLLLHPLDFLDADDVPSLAFFPAMAMKRKQKIDLIDRLLETYTTWFEIAPVGEHAAAAGALLTSKSSTGRR